MTFYKETEAETVEWSGWRLAGQNLEAPRKVRLAPSEARILRVLIAAKGKLLSADDVRERAKLKNNAGSRSTITSLRGAVGKDSIRWRRNAGYWLVSARYGRGPSTDPLDALIKNLSDALASAKALRFQRA